MGYNLQDMKKVALIDIDRTIYDGFSIVDLVRAQNELGIIEDSVYEKLANFYKSFKAGNIPYDSASCDALNLWAKELQGKSYAEVKALTETILCKTDKFHKFTLRLVQLLHDKGFHCVVVTGEPQFVGDYFLNVVDADSLCSSVYECEGDYFTGNVTQALCGSEGKEGAIRDTLDGCEVSTAFGDSEGDVGILNMVNFPFCVNPSDGLMKIAKERHWPTCSTDNVLDVVASML